MKDERVLTLAEIIKDITKPYTVLCKQMQKMEMAYKKTNLIKKERKKMLGYISSPTELKKKALKLF